MIRVNVYDCPQCIELESVSLLSSNDCADKSSLRSQRKELVAPSVNDKEKFSSQVCQEEPSSDMSS